MALEIGSILHERYRIEQVIAQGGMGAVYRATDQSLGVMAALKENLFASEEASRQFRREATILASLRHPNLPRVTDHFIIPGQGQYLVMDYIEGEDLHDRIERDGCIPEEEVVVIGAAICEALAYLHSRPAVILHRDIKPGNIKVTPSGQIFLVDFGLAKIDQPGQSTTTGAQALTPGYAPPEQYGSGTDPRSDVYSLGATLYAVLSCKIPEDGLSRAMGTAILTPLRKHKPGVGERVAQVIETALAIKMEDRYQDAAAFRNALLNANTAARRKSQALQQTQAAGMQAGPAPVQAAGGRAATGRAATGRAATGRAKKSFGKGAGIWVGFGVIALLAVCTLLAIFALRNRPFNLAFGAAPTLTQSEISSPTAEQAVMPVAAVTEAPVVVELTATETTAPTLVPDTATPEPSATAAATPLGGASGLIAFSSTRSGIAQVWVMEPDGINQRQVSNLPDGACQQSWSPDGRRMVVVSPCRDRLDLMKGASLFIINADGSGLQPLISVPGGDFEPAWSPDGLSIAFTSLREGIPHIYLYSLADGTIIRLSSVSSNDRHPVWSPDGSLIAFDTTRLGVSQIWTMNPDGSSPREFTTISGGAGSNPVWSPKGDVIVFSLGSSLPLLTARQFGVANAPEVSVAELRPAFDASYSTDGYWLAFESIQDGNTDIYRMTLSGGSITRLTDDPAKDWYAAWQP